MNHPMESASPHHANPCWYTIPNNNTKAAGMGATRRRKTPHTVLVPQKPEPKTTPKVRLLIGDRETQHTP